MRGRGLGRLPLTSSATSVADVIDALKVDSRTDIRKRFGSYVQEVSMGVVRLFVTCFANSGELFCCSFSPTV